MSEAKELEHLSGRLLSQKEVAQILGISVATLVRWEAKGEGPPRIVIGGSIRYSLASLNAWLAERTELPKQAAQ